MPNMHELRKQMLVIASQVQNINANKTLSAKEKASRISGLSGMSRRQMGEHVTLNYSTGMKLHESLRRFVSRHRPRLSDSPKGTKRSKNE